MWTVKGGHSVHAGTASTETVFARQLSAYFTQATFQSVLSRMFSMLSLISCKHYVCIQIRFYFLIYPLHLLVYCSYLTDCSTQSAQKQNMQQIPHVSTCLTDCEGLKTSCGPMHYSVHLVQQRLTLIVACPLLSLEPRRGLHCNSWHALSRRHERMLMTNQRQANARCIWVNEDDESRLSHYLARPLIPVLLGSTVRLLQSYRDLFSLCKFL